MFCCCTNVHFIPVSINAAALFDWPYVFGWPNIYLALLSRSTLFQGVNEREDLFPVLHDTQTVSPGGPLVSERLQNNGTMIKAQLLQWFKDVLWSSRQGRLWVVSTGLSVILYRFKSESFFGGNWTRVDLTYFVRCSQKEIRWDSVNNIVASLLSLKLSVVLNNISGLILKRAKVDLRMGNWGKWECVVVVLFVEYHFDCCLGFSWYSFQAVNIATKKCTGIILNFALFCKLQTTNVTLVAELS